MRGNRGGGGGNGGEGLHVNVPSFFRCPISLDVMRSPVSLSTGVTYDRSSIQAWLDTGHNTCPATMQVLPTNDFVPNHTLHRLIQLWSAQSLQQPQQQQQQPPINTDALIRALPSAEDPLPSLRRLAEVAGDAARIRELAENAACLPALHGVLVRKGVELGAIEAAVRVISPVIRCRKEGIVQIDGLIADLRVPLSLVAVLRSGSLEARIAAAWIVEAMASARAEATLHFAEVEGLLAELLRLVSDHGEKPADTRAVDAGLAALAAVSTPRRVRPRIVALGAVPAAGRVLARPSTPAATAERALRLMEAASTCTEGRSAICGDPAAVAAVVGRMTRVRPEAAERAVAVLWAVCHLSRDRRAQEAAASAGGLAKVLLVLQSNCSPAARQMGGDLLKILKASSKGDLPSYDSKTTHIAAF